MYLYLVFLLLLSYAYSVPIDEKRIHQDLVQELNLNNASYYSVLSDMMPFFGIGRGLSLIETNVAEALFGPPPYPLKTRKKPKQSYDYIIVGGGSAGSVLASRLSEDPRVSVLLLEAGGEESGFSTLPLAALFLRKSKRDWSFATAMQADAAKGLIGQSVPTPQGKCIGGSSAINGMLYSRGNPKDYDRWQELGAEGWSYADVFPYFVKSEGKILDKRYDSNYHGTRGPLTVSTPKDPLPTDILYFDAIKEAGLNIGDYNGVKQDRFNFADFTIRNGTRCSAARAYLGPAYGRDNLDIIINADVRRVLFDKKKAFGVLYEKDDTVFVVPARREVIVSAGTYNTPKLLMHSGIGPRNELKQHGIPVLVDSPGVGSNLQDHPYTLMSYTTKAKSSIVYTRFDQTAEATLNFVRDRSGLFTLPASEVNGFYRTKYASDERPDIEVHQTSVLFGGAFPTPLLGYIFNIKNEVTNDYFNRRPSVINSRRDGIVLQPTLVRPFSTGWVRLKSDDPDDPPIINPRLLSDPRDVEALVEGCKTVKKIGQTKAMRMELEAEPLPNTLPGCEKYKLMSDNYFECLVKTLTFTMFHGCCTAKMGSREDPKAVVDSELRVKGVENLRIVDASVMPEIVSGNTNAPTIMIAERAADLIKGKQLRKSVPPIESEMFLLKYDSEKLKA